MIDALISWLSSPNNTVALAIVGGVAGFIGKAVYDLWLARRKDQLERINQQLKMLYGPLYALNQAGGIAWETFRSKVRPGGAFFGRNPPPTREELIAWRLWMLIVFRPIHDEMLSIVTKNADLLIENDLPEELKAFCAHVVVYRVVFEKWKAGDFSEHTSLANYPTEALNAYLESSFVVLKQRQTKLLGRHATMVDKKTKKERKSRLEN